MFRLLGEVMKYILSIVLDTDRRLLKHEVAELVSSLELQLEEPQNMDNEDALWHSKGHSINVGVDPRI